MKDEFGFIQSPPVLPRGTNAAFGYYYSLTRRRAGTSIDRRLI
ncbi:MAG: hypothetical protein ACTTKL_00950 [Treponema sp.]